MSRNGSQTSENCETNQALLKNKMKCYCSQHTVVSEGFFSCLSLFLGSFIYVLNSNIVHFRRIMLPTQTVPTSRRSKKRPSYGIRTVELPRGPGGFGFTLSGQGPCILSNIVVGSPADRAGLKPGKGLTLC